jgi:hypothetical protein
MKNANTGRAIQSDLDSLRSMADEDIDTSDIPPIPEEWFERAVWRASDGTWLLRVDLDSATREYFLARGRRGMTEAAEALREYAATRIAAS